MKEETTTPAQGTPAPAGGMPFIKFMLGPVAYLAPLCYVAAYRAGKSASRSDAEYSEVFNDCMANPEQLVQWAAENVPVTTMLGISYQADRYSPEALQIMWRDGAKEIIMQ